MLHAFGLASVEIPCADLALYEIVPKITFARSKIRPHTVDSKVRHVYTKRVERALSVYFGGTGVGTCSFFKI